MAEVVIEPGMFSWVDLTTTDVSAVLPFYEKVFGWSVEEVPGAPGHTGPSSTKAPRPPD